MQDPQPDLTALRPADGACSFSGLLEGRRWPRAIVLGSLLALGMVTGAASPARAWKCCDPWGYDYPGFFVWRSDCEQAGGIVHNNTATCPNSVLPFKCCDAQGAPIPGVYWTNHECKAAGHQVFPGLMCPESGPFQCCNPDGGSAPGVYVFRWSCAQDGYVVQDFTSDGCPGAWRDRLANWWTDNRLSIRCPRRLKEDYAPSGVPIPQTRLGKLLADHDADYTDKDEHCTLSCLLAVECGERSARLAGWAKETKDMCDAVEGNGFGTGDECANDRGRDFGVTLPHTKAADAEEDCASYCTGLATLEQDCALNELARHFLEIGFDAALTEAEMSIPPTILGLDNPLYSFWTKLIKKCSDFLIAGLTTSTPSAATVADLKARGQTLIAGAQEAGLAVGQSARFPGGALMTRVEVDRYTLAINVPGAELNAYLEYAGGVLESLQLLNPEGRLVSMTMADPIDTACPSPPCEKRLPWMVWSLERDPFPALVERAP